MRLLSYPSRFFAEAATKGAKVITAREAKAIRNFFRKMQLRKKSILRDDRIKIKGFKTPAPELITVVETLLNESSGVLDMVPVTKTNKRVIPVSIRICFICNLSAALSLKFLSSQ